MLLSTTVGYAIIQVPDFIIAICGNAKKRSLDDDRSRSTINKRIKCDDKNFRGKSKKMEYFDDEKTRLQNARTMRTTSPSNNGEIKPNGVYNLDHVYAKIQELECNMESIRKNIELEINNYKKDIENLKGELNP